MDLLQLTIYTFGSLLFLTLLGYAVSFGPLKKPLFFPIIGFSYLVFISSVISNLFSSSVSSAELFSVLIASPFLVWKVYNREYFHFLKYCYTNLIALISICLLGLEKHFLGVINFDFFTAVQDGRFLVNHGALQEKFSSAILPLTWSAGTGSRYDVSFLIAGFLRVFSNVNVIALAESFLIVFFAAGVASCVELLRTWTGMAERKIYVFGLIATFSSLLIFELNNQMFGQITALPLVYLIYATLPNKETLLIRDWAITIVASLTLFLIYTSIILPVGLGIFIYLGLSIKKNSFRLLRILSLTLMTVFLSLLLFSSNLTWPLKMLQAYTASNVIRARLFPQMVSLIGPGQFLGFWPVSSTVPWSGWLVGSIILFSILLIGIFIFYIFRLDWTNRNGVFSLFLSYSFFLIYAYVTGNSYVLLKVAIWVSLPIFLFSLYMISRLVKNIKMLKLIGISILSMFVMANLNLSYSELNQLRNGRSTSFPNSVTISQLNALNHLQISQSNVLGIVAPTGEQEALIAAGLKLIYSNRVVGLGAQGQVFTEGQRSNCNFTQSLSAAKRTTHILLPSNFTDITPPVTENSVSHSTIPGFNIFSLSNVQNLMVVSSGLYPPTVNSQIDRNPIPDSQALRWGTHRICLLDYALTAQKVKLSIPFLLGPDYPTNPKWRIGTGIVEVSAAQFGISRLTASFNEKQGWNPIEIDLINYRIFSAAHWYGVRADARSLDFAIGTIKRM